MPLPDGTNDEKEDLAVPLPAEWTKESLKNVVLYGTHASPCTAKVRALLNLAGVAYERRFGKASGSYTKFPVLFVNDRQINDSYIIFKSLAPILFGKPYSEEDVKLEELITYGLLLACEKEAFGGVENMKRWSAVAGLTHVTGFLVRNLAPLSLAQKAADRVASRYPHLKTSLEYCQELKEALDQRGTPFFAGEQAGALDASCYGALCVWHAGGEESMEFAKEAVTQSGLDPWFERTRAAIPSVFDLQGWWPLYT